MSCCMCVVVRRLVSRAPLNFIMAMVMVGVVVNQYHGQSVASDFEHAARLLPFLVSASKHLDTSQQRMLAALNIEPIYESTVGQLQDRVKYAR